MLQLDHLRSGIGLRAYAQRDPLNEYKGEAFSLFEALLDGLREAVTTVLAHIELRLDEPQANVATRQPAQQMRESHVNPLTGEDEARPPPQLGFGGRAIKGPIDPAEPATWGKVARNAPCPCGTGKKYKHCHGKP